MMTDDIYTTIHLNHSSRAIEPVLIRFAALSSPAALRSNFNLDWLICNDQTTFDSKFHSPFGMGSDRNYYMIEANPHDDRVFVTSQYPKTRSLYGEDNELLFQNGIYLECPQAVCFSPHGDLFITNRYDYSVIIDTLKGIRRISRFKNHDNKYQELTKPYGLCFSAKGICYVSLPWNNQIISIERRQKGEYPDSIVEYGASLVCGSVAGFLDGNLKNAKFSRPLGLLCGQDGKIFVVDKGNDAIRIIDLDKDQVSSLYQRKEESLRFSPFDLLFQRPQTLHLSLLYLLYDVMTIDHTPCEVSELFEIYEIDFGFPKRQPINKKFLSVIAPNLMKKEIRDLIGETIQEQSLELIFCVLLGRQVLQNPSQQVDYQTLLALLDAYFVSCASGLKYIRRYFYHTLAESLKTIKTTSQLCEVCSKVSKFEALLKDTNIFLEVFLEDAIFEAVADNRSFTYNQIKSIDVNDSNPVLHAVVTALLESPENFESAQITWEKFQTQSGPVMLPHDPSTMDLSSNLISPRHHVFTRHPIASTFESFFRCQTSKSAAFAPNFRIIVGNHSFDCHDWYLASRWPFFHQALLFKGVEWETKSLTLDPTILSLESVAILLDYLYFYDTSALTEKDAINILHNGDYCGILTKTQALPGFEYLVYVCIMKVESRYYRQFLPSNVTELKHSCFQVQMKPHQSTMFGQSFPYV